MTQADDQAPSSGLKTHSWIFTPPTTGERSNQKMAATAMRDHCIGCSDNPSDYIVDKTRGVIAVGITHILCHLKHICLITNF
jgi:hypothetical protein